MAARLLAGILLTAAFMNLAWAELVVVVSSDNPNSELTRTELSDIFLGRRNRFPNGDLVVPVNRRESSDPFKVFYSQYLNMTPAQVRAHWSRLIFSGRGQPPRTVADGSAMADTIASDPHGIGYLEPGMVDERLRVVRVE
jgi:ABC-type phosphate transport system substrate-binding protein